MHYPDNHRYHIEYESKEKAFPSIRRTSEYASAAYFNRTIVVYRQWRLCVSFSIFDHRDMLTKAIERLKRHRDVLVTRVYCNFHYDTRFPLRFVCVRKCGIRFERACVYLFSRFYRCIFVRRNRY